MDLVFIEFRAEEVGMSKSQGYQHASRLRETLGFNAWGLVGSVGLAA